MKESNEFFAFRQRVGRLNWKVINSIDTDNLVEKVSISELQAVLDSVTFCKFTENEINRQSSELVTKVCHLMQYTIEYLLHCQEMQAQQLDDAAAANEELQLRHLKLKMAHVANKEALKGYRSQLKEFKESARNLGLEGKLFPSASTTNKMRVVMEPKKDLEPAGSSGNRESVAAETMRQLIESIQQREADSVEQLATVLRQQRDHFFREIGQRGGASSSSHSAVREEVAEAVQQITEQFESYKKQMQGDLDKLRAGSGNPLMNSELQVRVAAFEAEKRLWETQKQRAEADLEAMAQEVVRAKMSVQPVQLSPYRPAREKQPVSVVATSTSSLFGDSATGTDPDRTLPAPASPELTVVEVNYHRNSLILIKHMLLRYFMRYSVKHSLKSAWNKWMAFKAEAKCVACEAEKIAVEEQLKQAAAARQAELAKLLSAERQKSVIAVARHNASLSKMRDGYEKQLQAVKVELLRYHQKDEDRDRSLAQSTLAGEHQAAAVSAVHPLVLEARTEDDLYLKLQGRIMQNPVISKDYTKIMSDIAAEMGERLRHCD